MLFWRKLGLICGALICGLAVTCGVLSAAETNLLQNSGFEEPLAGDMPPGWGKGKHFGKLSPGSSWALDNTGAQEGKACLKIVSGNGEIPVITQSVPYSVHVGDKLTFTIYLKADKENIRVKLLLLSTDFKQTGGKEVQVGTSWQPFTITLPVTNKGQKTDYCARFDLLAPGILWADQASFTSSGGGTPAAAAGAEQPAVALPEKGNNVLVNPGFETASASGIPEGWSKGAHYGKKPEDSAYASAEGQGHGGSKGMKLTSVTGEIPVILHSGEVNAAAGETYVFSVWLRAEGDKPVPCGLYLLSSDFKCIGQREVFAGKDWRRCMIKLKINEKQKSNRLYARFDLKETGSVIIDDAVLARVDAGADLLQYDSAAYGYRMRDDTGGTQVSLTLGERTGKTLPNLGGVCTFDPLLKELKLKVVRVHNVLTSFDILSRNSSGALQYNWQKLDAYVDGVLAAGAVPQMCLCFVPMELVANPDPKKIRKDYTPPFYLGAPTDLPGWEAYVAAVIRHCREKYDTAGWYWIFGNEPGVAQFSMGTEEEYFTLYQHTVKAAREADPQIRIGAGSFAHLDWLKRFIERCGKNNVPVDLLSWHHYGILPEEFLTHIERVRVWAAEYPNLKNAALLVDEWNPMLPDDGTALSANEYGAAQAAATLKYMYDGGILYHAFFMARSAIRRNALIQPDGTKNPTFNVLKMAAMLGEHERKVTVPEDEPYVGALAADATDGATGILVWNARYHSDLHPAMAKEVTIALGGSFGNATAEVYLIDNQHSNGYNDPQHQELEKTTDFRLENGNLRLTMKSDSVALVLLKQPH